MPVTLVQGILQLEAICGFRRPAGEYGDRFPASISTDQQGRDRGYVILSNRGLANDDALNPSGNYISTFNGTSAAAPNASGAIAVLLS